jgi:nitroreductase
MDTRLAISSRRETRDYADRDLPADVVERILDAGRLAGSAANRQPWVFVVVDDPELRASLAEQVYEPANVQGAKFVVAIAASGKGPLAFDCGRAAQNMLLAAWNEGVGSCPNGMPDPEAVGRLLGLADDERAYIILTFGYPVRQRDPASQTPEEWSNRANRKPLAQVLRRR